MSEQTNAVEKPTEPEPVNPATTTPDVPKPVIESEKAEITESSKTVNNQAEEKIKVVIIISGVQYEAEIVAGSSVYYLMNILKAENKIDFKGKNYPAMGFFVEEINGLKNNPAGKNWIYYVNGQPAPVGISNYLIKANDIIEWKYEEKSF